MVVELSIVLVVVAISAIWEPGMMGHPFIHKHTHFFLHQDGNWLNTEWSDVVVVDQPPNLCQPITILKVESEDTLRIVELCLHCKVYDRGDSVCDCFVCQKGTNSHIHWLIDVQAHERIGV